MSHMFPPSFPRFKSGSWSTIFSLTLTFSLLAWRPPTWFEFPLSVSGKSLHLGSLCVKWVTITARTTSRSCSKAQVKESMESIGHCRLVSTQEMFAATITNICVIISLPCLAGGAHLNATFLLNPDFPLNSSFAHR